MERSTLQLERNRGRVRIVVMLVWSFLFLRRRVWEESVAVMEIATITCLEVLYIRRAAVEKDMQV